MEKLLTQCRSYSRKGAKTQSLPGSKQRSLRLCVFAGEVFLLLIVLSPIANAQPKLLSEQAAATAMTALWQNSGGYPSRWTYDHGLVLKGIERVYLATGDKWYLDFVQRSMDHFVNDDGSIRTYKIDEYNIDNINPGRNLLFPLQNNRPGKVSQGRRSPPRTIKNTPAHVRRWFLAPEDLPIADVA
ncbi:MAG: unsaturated rhamnogalacturonyl hydrolase [Acidobacteriota bacterium]